MTAASAQRRLPAALRLDFTLRPGRWVDLDTLVEETVRGLRAADALPRLDEVVASKSFGGPAGCSVSAVRARDRRPPGRRLLEVDGVAPRPGDRAAKVAWRAAIGASWARPVLTGEVWAEVALAAGSALLARLEPVLDALEPVLGRDPRGRTWQEFFPFDDRLVWLHVIRFDAPAGAVRLRLGEVG